MALYYNDRESSPRILSNRGEDMRRHLVLLLVLLSSSIVAGAQRRSARITAILPAFGAPGTTVTIRGAGFSGFESGSWAKQTANEPAPGAVEFNGVPGDVLFWGDDLITVKVPIGASTGPVRVVNPGAKIALTGESFEVPYSGSGQSGVKHAESADAEISKRSSDEARG